MIVVVMVVVALTALRIKAFESVWMLEMVEKFLGLLKWVW